MKLVLPFSHSHWIHKYKPERLFTWRRSLRFTNDLVIHSVIHASSAHCRRLCRFSGRTVPTTVCFLEYPLLSNEAWKKDYFFGFVLFESLFSFFHSTNAPYRKEGISFFFFLKGSAQACFIKRMTSPLTLPPLSLIGSLAGVMRRDPGLVSLPFKTLIQRQRLAGANWH